MPHGVHGVGFHVFSLFVVREIAYVHVTNAYRDSRVTGPYIFNIGTRWRGDRGSTVVKVLCYSGAAVAQRLRCCATVGPR